MKKYLYVALALALLGGCKKTRVEVQENIDSFIANSYRADAEQMLGRLYLSNGLSAGADEATLNAVQLDLIEKRLSAIYRLHTPTTDSLFNTLKLHTYPNVDLRSIELEIDSTSAAGKHVVDYEPSGDAGFDGLMSKYNFSYVPPPPTISNYGFLTITSTQSLNISALLKSFRTYAFVEAADDNGLTGDGSDITYEIDATGAIITFQQKSEDCIDGCELIKSWRFGVDSNGKATYLGE